MQFITSNYKTKKFFLKSVGMTLAKVKEHYKMG